MFGKAKTWQINVAIFFIISGGVLLGLVFGQVNGAAAIFFPAAGMSSALYYLFRKRIAIGLFSAVFLMNLIYRVVWLDEVFTQSLTLSALFLLSNAVGILVFCIVLRTVKYRVDLAFSFVESGKFMLTVIASSLASALIGLIALKIHFNDIDTIKTFFYWMIGDATGIIVFGSLILNHVYHDKPIFSQKNTAIYGIVFILGFAMLVFLIFGEYGHNFLTFGTFQVFLVLMYIVTAFVFSFRMIAVNNIIFLLGLNFLHFPAYNGDDFILEAIVLSLFLIIVSSTTSVVRIVILDRQNNYEQVRIAKDNLEKIIISTNNLVNVENILPQDALKFDRAYLKNMFEIACEIYPEFDKASCNLISANSVEFIAAAGYDVDDLNSMNLSVSDFLWDIGEPEYFGPKQYRDKFEKSNQSGNFEESYGFPKESIRFTVNIGEERFAGMSFDLFKGSEYNFNAKDLNNFKSFQRLMNSYYKIGILNNEKDVLKDDIVLSLVRTLELYDLYTSGHS